MAGKAQPIIVIKKNGGHGGHHGGAWKVAYADFVTAMMALFIVLWLMGQSDQVKKAVAGYFNDPKGTATLLGTTMSGTGSGTTPAADPNQKQLQDLKEKLEQEIQARKDLEKLNKQIEMTITSEGLRIELMEDKNGTFYQSGSAKLSPSGQELLALLATELKTLPNQLQIEGHTDAAQYSQRRQLQQLGALSRPRQLRASPAAAGWSAGRSSDADTRLRGPTAARKEQSLRPFEPPHLHSGEEQRQCTAAAVEACTGGGRRFRGCAFGGGATYGAGCSDETAACVAGETQHGQQAHGAVTGSEEVSAHAAATLDAKG